MYPGDRVVTGAVMRFGAVDFVGSATFPTSHISVAGTATARNADAVSATVPAVPAGATGKWCLAVTAQPEEGRAWATSGYTMALSMGTFGAANSTSVNFYSDGKMYWSVRDATAGDRYIDPAFTFTAGSAHRVVVCNSGGTLKATWDGSPVTATATGPGAGVFGTSPTSLRFGDVSSGAYTFGGYLKNLKICGPAKNAKECK
jgi:hypothetical protein